MSLRVEPEQRRRLVHGADRDRRLPRGKANVFDAHSGQRM